MGEYFAGRKTKKPPKGCKNNMGEIEFDLPLENETSKQKIPKRKIIEKPIHPQERKEL